MNTSSRFSLSVKAARSQHHANLDQAASHYTKTAPGSSLRREFGLLFFSLIFLQKVAVGAGTIKVSVSLVVLYGILAKLSFAGRLQVSAFRALLFLGLSTVAMLSQMIARSFSVPSVILLILLYLPFVTVWNVDRAEWLRIIAVFQDMMLVPAGMVFVQIAWQIVFHMNALSIEPYIPRALAMQGFMYSAPIHWGQALMRPNGFFMLEPSYISAFAASAFVIEALVFHRTWRLAWYFGALLVSTGVTGLVLAIVAAPFVLSRQSPLLIASVIPVLIVAGVAVAGSGSADFLIDRLSELRKQDSSGFGRLVLPLLQLSDSAKGWSFLITGVGAGNIDQATEINSSAWPIVKLGIEYGFATMLVFVALIVTCVWGSPAPALASGLFVVFNFTGGYLLNPVLVILIFTHVAALRLTRQAQQVP